MAVVTSRKFFEELGLLVGKPVAVFDTAGKSYDGELLGYDSNTLSICLGNVNTERGKAHRVFIAGASVARIRWAIFIACASSAPRNTTQNSSPPHRPTKSLCLMCAWMACAVARNT